LTFTYTYDLTEDAGTTAAVRRFPDSGSTWTVATNTAAGESVRQVNGTAKTITWNAGTDYTPGKDDEISLTATDTYQSRHRGFG
jgi:hypothetical protein